VQVCPVALCYLAGLASLFHNFCSHPVSTYAEVGALFCSKQYLAFFFIVR
jgi:hypothetical protein